MRIIHIVGARPNFMKAAPVIKALGDARGLRQILVHTGQHYDVNMSKIFFYELNLPRPDINLNVGSGTHAEQTANIMVRLEPVLRKISPELVLVYGDVNSTVAAALVAAKLGIKVGHVEAGLRSFDRSMPEEINRILTDQIADLLFTPSRDAGRNLLREGISRKKIFFVGNVMIDTLIECLPKARKRWSQKNWITDLLGLGGKKERYGLLTIHRPSNVDNVGTLRNIMKVLNKISRDVTLVFPVHPRTRIQLKKMPELQRTGRIFFIDPIGYIDTLALQKNAAFVITDSGGIQEETTYLGVPCFTLRPNTERPVTVTLGTNMIIGQNYMVLEREITRVLSSNYKNGKIPVFWDGEASHRIRDIIIKRNESRDKRGPND